MCFFQFRFWSKITPKYFVDSNSSIESLFISRFMLRGGFFLMCISVKLCKNCSSEIA